MNNGRNMEHSPGFSLVDIYFVVFRQKWLIIIFTALGLAAGTTYYFMRPPTYQSSAKLMIKYVSDSRPMNPADNGSPVTATSDLNSSLMNSELQILTSFDLYEQVATNVGADKVLAKIGGGSDAGLAASIISGGVKVEPSRDSTVIQITFNHPDPTIVRPVLSAIIDSYREKHMQVHKAIGISDDFLMEKTSNLQQQIAQIEDELRMAKTNAGIIDVADAEKAYSDEISRIRRELFQAQADLAEHQASLAEIKGSSLFNSKTTNVVSDEKIPDDVLTRYKAVCARIAYLQKRQTDYLFVQGYTEQNKLVKENREQLSEATALKSSLEETNSALAALDFSAASTASAGANGGTGELTSLPTRVKILTSQLAQIQSEAVKMGDAEAKINELMRKKQIKESYFDNLKNTFEHRQIDEELGPGQLYSNLPLIQVPTPPFRDFKKFYKNIAMLVAGVF